MDIFQLHKVKLIPPPEIIYQTITINVDILSFEDRDLYLPVKKQLQLMEPKTLQLFRYHMSPKCSLREKKCVKQDLDNSTAVCKSLKSDTEQLEIIRTVIECSIA